MTASQAARQAGMQVDDEAQVPELQPDAETEIDNLLAAGLFARNDEAEGDDTPPEDPDDEAGDDTGEWDAGAEGDSGEMSNEEPDAGEQPVDDANQVSDVDRWAQVIRENPRRLAEIPGRARADAVARALQLVEQEARLALGQQVQGQVEGIQRSAFQQGMLYARQVIDAVDEYNELAAMQEEESEEWFELTRSKDPKDIARLRRFLEWQERGGPEAALPNLPPPIDPVQVANAAFTVAMGPVVDLVKQNKQLQALLTANEQRQPGRYALGPAGVVNFLTDVLAAVSSGQAGSSPQASRSSEAQRRQQAARQRQNLPRPTVAGDGGRPEASPSGSWRDLVQMGWREELKRIKR